MITRKTEVQELDKYYTEEGSQMLLLYGRDGSEKEDLLLSFTKNKPFFYYRSANASEKQQKELLRQFDESANGSQYEKKKSFIDMVKDAFR